MATPNTYRVGAVTVVRRHGQSDESIRAAIAEEAQESIDEAQRFVLHGPIEISIRGVLSESEKQNAGLDIAATYECWQWIAETVKPT